MDWLIAIRKMFLIPSVLIMVSDILTPKTAVSTCLLSRRLLLPQDMNRDSNLSHLWTSLAHIRTRTTAGLIRVCITKLMWILTCSPWINTHSKCKYNNKLHITNTNSTWPNNWTCQTNWLNWVYQIQLQNIRTRTLCKHQHPTFKIMTHKHSLCHFHSYTPQQQLKTITITVSTKFLKINSTNEWPRVKQHYEMLLWWERTLIAHYIL